MTSAAVTIFPLNLSKSADNDVTYGGTMKRPTTHVASTQSETNASPGCQKNLLSCVTFSSLAMTSAEPSPSSTVSKNGVT